MTHSRLAIWIENPFILLALCDGISHATDGFSSQRGSNVGIQFSSFQAENFVQQTFAMPVIWHAIQILWGHWDVSYVYQMHYTDVTMSPMASQITSLIIVYSNVYSGADQRKHQSSASLAFVRRIHRGPVNSPNKWPVTRKMFSFDDVIMEYRTEWYLFH